MLFEIPSNLYLQKIGARKTFARITILRGITSIATMFVTTATGFYILPFLLGLVRGRPVSGRGPPLGHIGSPLGAAL